MEHLINNAKLSQDEFVEAVKNGSKVKINEAKKKLEIQDPREGCGLDVL